jgi:hypothetical protein
MMLRSLVILAVSGALLACNQPAEAPVSDAQETQAQTAAAPNLPAVDAALLAAANDQFAAIEPSEIGVSGAPTIAEAMAPLLGPEVSEGANISLSIRETGDDAVADVVSAGLLDDSVSAAHVRVEFRREPSEGWYPVNAYRRQQCARGEAIGQWSAAPCP